MGVYAADHRPAARADNRRRLTTTAGDSIRSESSLSDVAMAHHSRGDASALYSGRTTMGGPVTPACPAYMRCSPSPDPFRGHEDDYAVRADSGRLARPTPPADVSAPLTWDAVALGENDHGARRPGCSLDENETTAAAPVVGQDGFVWTGTVRRLSKEDADGCDATIHSLPYFFGQEGGIADCARAVRSQDGLVAVDEDGAVLGFLTHESHYPFSAEITWMAVRQDFRRIGIGRRLIARLAEDASGIGFHTLFVVTLGPSALEPGVTDGYGGTREFYEQILRANGVRCTEGTGRLGSRLTRSRPRPSDLTLRSGKRLASHRWR